MNKSYCSLGLMSGTSADGVDASIIQSDGDNEYEVILDKYFKYRQNIYENIHNLKDEINDSKDLKNLSKKAQSLEKEITLFQADVVNAISRCINKVAVAGKWAGGFVPQTTDDIKWLLDMGMRFITYDVDSSILYRQSYSVVEWFDKEVSS